MKKQIKGLARTLVRELAWKLEGRAEAHVCFSQNGEDLLLDSLLGDGRDGFYVDVGSYDPVRFSNTYRLYLRGWSGIAIDPMPGVAERFRAIRPRDIAIESAVSDVEAEATLHVFNEPAWNTLRADLAENLIARGYPKLVNKLPVTMRSLKTLLAPHVKGRTIDLMTIDVEGNELPVLRSHDWDGLRPRWVAIEVGQPALRLPSTAEAMFLAERDYLFHSQTSSTAFFRDERRKP